MKDIVARLRMQNEVRLSLGNDFSDLLLDAAARIEALEAALEASDTLGKYWQARAIKAEGIPAALAEGQDGGPRHDAGMIRGGRGRRE